VHLASVRDVHEIVLVTPYDSVMNVAKHQFPIFDSYSKARGIDVPMLLLLAEHDRVIPRRHSERLAAALSPEHVRMRTIRGTDHDSIADSAEYHQALRDFLRF